MALNLLSTGAFQLVFFVQTVVLGISIGLPLNYTISDHTIFTFDRYTGLPVLSLSTTFRPDSDYDKQNSNLKKWALEVLKATK